MLKRDIQTLRTLYDAEVAFVDSQFGSFQRELERMRVWENSIVVVTSDHGEEFGEHGSFVHGLQLHDELLRIPLLVKLTGPPSPHRTGYQVSHLNIVPGIFDLLGFSSPKSCLGRSLFDEKFRTIERCESFILSEAGSESNRWSSRIYSLRSERIKYISDRQFENELIFDLKRDPKEQSPVLGLDPEPFRTRLRQHFSRKADFL